MAVCYESFLLDEKLLHTLDAVEPPRAVPVSVQNIKSEYTKSADPQYFFKEFQTMYDVVELGQCALTPPQSPPSERPLLTTLEPLLTAQDYNVLSSEKADICTVPHKPILVGNDIVEFNYLPGATPQPDIAHELAVVEELVRSRVEDMQWSTSSCGSSPGSPGGSSCSNFGDYPSDDPEWAPEAIENYDKENANKTSRKRSKPHWRGPPEEKKFRKKEQNKNAATRYRLKKKAEVEEILTVEKQLLEKNSELGNKICDMQREIKYLKGLMRDLFKAKGLIN